MVADEVCAWRNRLECGEAVFLGRLFPGIIISRNCNFPCLSVSGCATISDSHRNNLDRIDAQPSSSHRKRWPTNFPAMALEAGQIAATSRKSASGCRKRVSSVAPKRGNATVDSQFAMFARRTASNALTTPNPRNVVSDLANTLNRNAEECLPSWLQHTC